jgi:hypothetical protein
VVPPREREHERLRIARVDEAVAEHVEIAVAERRGGSRGDEEREYGDSNGRA